jgi:hypothetical protein
MTRAGEACEVLEFHHVRFFSLYSPSVCKCPGKTDQGSCIEMIPDVGRETYAANETLT